MNKRAFAAYALGLVLIVSSLFYIRYNAAQAGTLIRRDVMTIIPVRQDASLLLELSDITEWANLYDGVAAAERIEMRLIESRASAVFAPVSMTGQDYFQMVYLPFIAGSSWQAGDEHVVILCRAMAWHLFGATDVVSLPVQIGGTDYIVVGVVESVVDSTSDGFAWIPQDYTDVAGILYLKPTVYNPLTARLDAEALLYDLHRPADGFIITDGNTYVESIALRGQILLALCIPGVLFAVGLLLYRLFRLAKSRASYVVAGLFTAVAMAVMVFFFRTVSAIDMWLPAFAEGYAQRIFNTGLLAPRSYLSAPLARLLDLNVRANVAFGTGLLGIGIVCITRFLLPSGVVRERRDT